MYKRGEGFLQNPNPPLCYPDQKRPLPLTPHHSLVWVLVWNNLQVLVVPLLATAIINSGLGRVFLIQHCTKNQGGGSSVLSPAGLVGAREQARGAHHLFQLLETCGRTRCLGRGYLGYAWIFLMLSLSFPIPNSTCNALGRQWLLLSENFM